MSHTTEYYKLRIHMLEERDAMVNQNIINKLKRKIRVVERAENIGQD